MKSKGFTLIELLVVIAIISLLASIVLSSLQDARYKASNSHLNSYVMEYAKALALYKDTNKYFPLSNLDATPKNHCLGWYTVSGTQNICGTGGIIDDITSGETPLSASLKPYLSTFPGAGTKPTPTSWGGMIGIQYKCNDVLCNKAILVWYLRGKTSCARPANASIFNSSFDPTYSYTSCVLFID